MYEEKIKSEGKCVFCKETFTSAGINRHLKKHLTEKAQKGLPGVSYYLKIEQNPKWGKAPYFLYLWVSSEMQLVDLDHFLRDIWLECCGHMSSFILADGKELDKDTKAKEIFYKGFSIDYIYDWGTSTELTITVVEELLTKADASITLLSRNNPLNMLCHTCKKETAVEICTAHDWGEDSLFCKKCAKKHAKNCEDYTDYAAMPIVNSPRIGECGYTGGTIDLERD